ncbi:hypothetical protein [Paenibacillus lautus]|uniref:Uncharacterized protein n=1 Tax=Paenibacillus lautus TaxID=1401 RepID=A0A385TFJ9_PAELA|nr:hypothetical protein [Paenibacillus lautus]AYB41788.1 hypothetical protein D5F53_00055 [Paenibacillus lautus]
MFKRKSANPILLDELREDKAKLIAPLFDNKPRANIHAKMEYLDRLIRMNESKYSLLASEAKHVAERLNDVCDSIEKDLGIDDHTPDFDSDINVTVEMSKGSDEVDEIVREVLERISNTLKINL